MWTVGSLAKDATARLIINARVNLGVAGQSFTSWAELVAVDQYELNVNNNAPSVVVAAVATDIEVVKRVSSGTPAIGALIDYTIEAKHRGPGKNLATGLVISDVLPMGATFVSATPEQGAYDPLTGRWEVGNLVSGAAAKKLVLRVSVDAWNPAVGTVITNTAWLLSLDQTETTPLNNSGRAIFTIKAPTPTPTPTPTPAPIPLPLLVNAGGKVYMDTQGQTWQQDKAYSVGSWGYVSGSAKSSRTAVNGTVDDGCSRPGARPCRWITASPCPTGPTRSRCALPNSRPPKRAIV